MDIISDCVFFYLLFSIAFLLYMLRKGVHVLTRCTECQWMTVLRFFFLYWKIERLHVCIFKKKSFLLYDKSVQSGTFIQWHVSLSASFLMPVLRMNERYLKLRLFLIRPASLVFTHIKNDMTHFICISKKISHCFTNYSISLCNYIDCGTYWI